MKLDAHGWQLDLRPDAGGAIGALRYHGNDVLRPAPAGTDDPLETGCFPLIPYANRIAHGRFGFAGREHRLPLNFGDHPHSLHGIGWQAPWRVAETAADHVTLVQTHDGGDGWPWPYRAEQHFALTPDSARIGIALTNLADAAMPAGLGLHPYFPRDAATRFQAASTGVWLADATMLPTEPAPAWHFGDWAAGAPVEGEGLIDNAYEGWNGAARIEQGWGTIAITARGAPFFHFYRPPDVDFFCVEPVSHLPDAINRGGMDVLAPGATMTLEMTLTIAR